MAMRIATAEKIKNMYEKHGYSVFDADKENSGGISESTMRKYPRVFGIETNVDNDGSYVCFAFIRPEGMQEVLEMLAR